MTDSEKLAVFQGITIKPLVNMLNIKKADDREKKMNEQIFERVSVCYRWLTSTDLILFYYSSPITSLLEWKIF